MSIGRVIIGITASFEPSGSGGPPGRREGSHVLPEAYVRAVGLAGGTAVILPSGSGGLSAEECLATVDGLILSGGGDVAPLRFGEEPIPALGPVDPIRDEVELALCCAALSFDIPVLAICRGAQVLNVAAGGTVLQDIAAVVPKPLQHQQSAPIWHPSHTIDVVPESLLSQALGATRMAVNSFHHQAVGVVAPGFRAAAHAADGVIEAVESLDRTFVAGVQFHAEGMADTSPEIARLFRAFVAAARRRAEGRAACSG
jgi:putative glutamine amidotransferase